MTAYKRRKSPIEQFEDFFCRHDGIVSKEKFDDFIEKERLSLTNGLKSKLLKKKDQYIYKPLLNCEKSILKSVKVLVKHDEPGEGLSHAIDEFIKSYKSPPNKSQLSKEADATRFDVLRRLLMSSSRLVVLRGAPGSTKSTLARYAIAILKDTGEESDNQDFWILSKSHKAMAKFRDRAGIYGSTLQKALGDFRKQLIPEGAVVAVDEAGLLGTYDMDALLQKAIKHNWRKLILLGDCRQEKPNDPGQPLALVENNFPDICFELSFSFRQKNKTARQFVSNIYEGNGVKALELMKNKSFLTFCDDQGHLKSEAVKTYIQSVKKNGLINVQTICCSGRTAKDLNGAISKAMLKDSDVAVKKIGKNPIMQGERVVVKRTAKGHDNETGYLKTVRTGRIGVVDKITKSNLYLRFFDRMEETLIKFEIRNIINKLDRAYAQTVRDTQGLAVDHSIFVIDGAINGQTMVSAGSRHRHSLNLIVNENNYSDLKAFAKDISAFPTKPILVDEA